MEVRKCHVCAELKPEDVYTKGEKRCRPCKQAIDRRYRERHREEISARLKKRWATIPEEKRRAKAEYLRKWRTKNAVKVATYLDVNAERRGEATRRWKESNPERVKEQWRRWKVENPEKVKASRDRHEYGGYVGAVLVLRELEEEVKKYEREVIASRFTRRNVAHAQGRKGKASEARRGQRGGSSSAGDHSRGKGSTRRGTVKQPKDRPAVGHR